MTAPTTPIDNEIPVVELTPAPELARKGMFDDDTWLVRYYAGDKHASEQGAGEDDELEIIGEEESPALPALVTASEIAPVVRGISYAIASHPARLAAARARAGKTPEPTVATMIDLRRLRLRNHVVAKRYDQIQQIIDSDFDGFYIDAVRSLTSKELEKLILPQHYKDELGIGAGFTTADDAGATGSPDEYLNFDQQNDNDGDA